jgi:hypothetical protein
MWCVIGEDFKNYWAGWQSIATIAQSIATIAALFFGGIWTWRRFFKFREGEPKIAVNLEVNFVRKQTAKWVITLDALLENKSKVRYEFKNFTFDISYTLAEDELENRKIKDEAGKDICLSAKFPHVAANGSWLDDAEDPEDRLDYGALEPGENDRWTFVACIPENATMVRAYSELLYDANRGWLSDLVAIVKSRFCGKETPESQESTKVLAVPVRVAHGVPY